MVQKEKERHAESPEAYSQLSELIYVFLFPTLGGQEING